MENKNSRKAQNSPGGHLGDDASLRRVSSSKIGDDASLRNLRRRRIPASCYFFKNSNSTVLFNASGMEKGGMKPHFCIFSELNTV